MANYIYSIKSIKYGTPTGVGTMPTAENLTDLGNTVRGSVTIEESEDSVNKFKVDQKRASILELSNGEGELTVNAQFPDVAYATLAELKGGTSSTAGGFNTFTPAVGFTSVQKALECELDSGHKINIFNAQIFSRIVNGGGRDKMVAMALKAVPLITADGLAEWEIKKSI
jgi:hypothetical protein